MIKRLVILSAIIASSLFHQVSISHSEEPLQIEEVYAIICQPQYLWDCDRMVATAFRESSYRPSATNYDCYPGHYNPATSKPYICAGLLQVMEFHVPNWTWLYYPY